MAFVQEVQAIYKNIAPHIRRTPLFKSDYFSETLGCDLYFKYEHLQSTGSYKIRGALSKASSLTPEEIAKGFVTASGGNHGLGVCYAARVHGTTATIFLPEPTPKIKVDKVRALGGETVFFGETFTDAIEKAQEFARNNDRIYIHGYDDEYVIRGQATMALEILEDLPQVDAILGSIGGGGMMSGIGAYTKGYNPSIKIYGSQTIGADAMYQSLKAGHMVKLEKVTSIAESIGARNVVARTFDYVRKYVDEVFRVTDDDAMEALREILQHDKQLVEPAASCSLAILTTGQVPDIQGKIIVVVLCGANFPLERLYKHTPSLKKELAGLAVQ